MILQTLYKKDTKGNMVEWTVEVVIGEYPTIVTKYGRVGGKLQEHSVEVREGKNLGKKNETSALEQAIKEAKAEWTKRLERKGYSLDGETDETSGVMLAVDYHDLAKRKKGVDLPSRVIVQPKLDGIRSKFVDGTFLSRTGTTQRAIPERIRHFMSGRQPTDGEMYIHGVSLRLLNGAVNKQSELSPRLGYHIFDLPIPGMPVEERMEALMDLWDWEEANHMGVHLVLPEWVIESEVASRKRDFENQGYEGIMIRLPGSPYLFHNKRSYGLIKWKEFMDAEFECLDVYADADGNAMLMLRAPNGSEFPCTVKGDDGWRKELLAEPGSTIGKPITVQFQGWLDSGLPQFARAIVTRDYE